MRVGDFHAVDFDEDEVVKLLGEHAGIELGNDFPDGGRLAGSRRAGDVYT